MNEDWIDEEVLPINDPRLLDILRDHAQRFKKPGKFVIEAGDNEYVLYAEDGELLDLCYLK